MKKRELVLVSCLLILFIIASGLIYFSSLGTHASGTISFTQTDWSGGLDSGDVILAGSASAWNKLSYDYRIDYAISPGDLELTQATPAFTKYARWTSLTSGTQVVSNIANNPQAISDGSGGSIFAYLRGGFIISAQKINNLGTPQWTTSGVAVGTGANGRNNPQIISDGSGGAIITWADSRSGSGGGYWDIYAQRINSAGVIQWTANGVPISVAPNDQTIPQITSDGQGGAIITWESYNSRDYDIYAQKINSAGTVQWAVNGVMISGSSISNNQMSPQIVSDGSGGAIIAWQDNRNIANYDIYAQRINSAGTVLWTAEGINICAASGDQTAPLIVSDLSGGVIILWQDNRAGNIDLYVQRINSSGTAQWTANGVAICTLASVQNAPQITSDYAGGAIIVWHDNRNGNNDIFSQKINNNGTIQWTANGASICTKTGGQMDAQVISDGLGGAIFAWEDRSPGLTDIFTQRVNSSGNILWTSAGAGGSVDGVDISVAVNSQVGPAIVSDGSNGAIIAWQDQRNVSSQDMFAQKVGNLQEYSPDGVMVSSIYDFGQQVNWGDVSWSADLPVRSSFDLQTKTSNDLQSLSEQSWSSPVTVSSGSSGSIPITSPSGRYIQYNITLKSGASTPIIHSLGISNVASGDTTPPTIGARTNTPASKISNASVQVNFTVTDDQAISAMGVSVSGVSYSSLSCTSAGPATSLSCTVFVTSSGTLHISATDDATNNATADEVGYVIDTTPPVSSMNNGCASPGNLGWCKSSVTVTISATDYPQPPPNAGVQSIEISPNNGNWGPYTVPFVLSNEGVTVRYSRATDGAGNVESPSQIDTIKIDTQPPSAVIINPLSVSGYSNIGTISAPLVVSWGASTDPAPGSGLAKYILCEKIGSDPYSCSDVFTQFLNRTSLSDGETYKYKVRAVDIAGNESADSPEVTVIIDRTTPTQPSISCPVWANTDGSATVSWGAVVDVSGIDHYDLRANSGSCSLYSCDLPDDPSPSHPYSLPSYFQLGPPVVSPLQKLESGLLDRNIYRYKVNAVDGAANEGDASDPSCEVKVDTTAPTTSIEETPEFPNANGWYNTDVYVVLSVDDNLSGRDLNWPQYKVGAGGSWSGSASLGFTISNEGTNDIYYKSVDVAGNQELENGPESIKIDKTAPSVGGNTVDLVGLTLNIDLTNVIDSISGINTIVSVVKDSGGNTVATINSFTKTGNDYSASHVFGSLPYDNYDVITTVKDMAGNPIVKSNSFSYSATPPSNTPPDITFSVSPSQTIGSGLITFSFQVKDNEDTNLTIAPSLLNVPSCSTISSLTSNTAGVNILGGIISVSGISSSWKDVDITWDAKADCNGSYVNNLAQVYLIANDSHDTSSVDSATFSLDAKNPDLPGTATDFNLLLDSKNSDSITLRLGPNGVTDDSNPILYKIFYKPGTSGVIQSNTLLTPSPFITSYVAGTTHTASSLTANTDYVFNIFGYDNYGNSTGASEISIKTDPPAQISISATGVEENQPVDGETTSIPSGDSSIDFGNIPQSENRLSALKISGSNPSGYSIAVSQNHNLRNGIGSEIAKFTANTSGPVTNANPLPWVAPSGAGYFGYSTTGLDRFNTSPRRYAAFNEIPETIASHATSAAFDDYLMLKVEIGSGQQSGIYNNTITITATPNIP